ncbi:TPA: site-specific integrase [Enterococcus faecalis]|uniref:site-specific integrase n=1 Tax=Enterococcus faecalis TaxID=1351 RepID=UPI00178770F7|nr:site-specific integrase [Enterococcus faecalis]MBD9871176.1 site-specific integrase [Enterococcus faecalis]HAP4755514.1 site-specific integrase [Enterococcus faecalis]
MANIKKYTKKDGSTAYMFNAYLGIDPLTGKSKRTTRRGFRTQKEAKLALAQLQIEIDRGKFVKQDYSRFKDVYELWYAQYVNSVKKSTAQRVEYYFVKQILPIFGELKINKITPAFCQNAVNEWFSTSRSCSALKIYTSKVFGFAINQHLITDNPMNRIIMPRKQRTAQKLKEQKFLDKEQLNNLLSVIQSNETYQSFVMFRLLAFTGIRKGELLALVWEDINLQEETLSINKSVSSLIDGPIITSTKTIASERKLSIDPQTLDYLKIWKLKQKKLLLSRGIRVKSNDRQLIFSNQKNEILYHNYLKEILDKYPEYQITVHSFRHTHSSLLFEAGASIKQVQERLGHADIKTTLDIYTHVTKSAEKDTPNIFLKYMNS